MHQPERELALTSDTSSMARSQAATRRGPAIIAPPPLLFAGPWLVGLVLDWLMRRAGTPVDPREAPTTLVTGGPFRLTRNPGYLGLSLTYLGLSTVMGARWPLVLLPGVLIAVDRGIIQREEQYLESHFRSEYPTYRRHVRRWL